MFITRGRHTTAIRCHLHRETRVAAAIAIPLTTVALLVAPALASATVTARVVSDPSTASGYKVLVTGDAAANSIHFAGGFHDSSGHDWGAEIWDPTGTVAVGSPDAPFPHNCITDNDFVPDDQGHSDNRPVLLCGASSDTTIDVESGGGNDLVRFEPGGNILFSGITVNGGDGADTIDFGYFNYASPIPVTLNGGNDNDTVTGNSSALTINGGAGDDKLTGSSADDFIHGGTGNDKLYGGLGNDHLFGEAGNDYLNGGGNDDTMDSGPGQDNVVGDDNTVDAGNDTINAVDGQRDSVACGYGADTARVDPQDVVETGNPYGCESVKVIKRVNVSLALPHHQHVLQQKAILAKVSCSGACYMGATADVKIGSKAPFEVDSDVFHLAHAGSKTIPLTLTKKQLKKIERALNNGVKVVATVYGELTKKNGDIIAETKGKKLTIKS